MIWQTVIICATVFCCVLQISGAIGRMYEKKLDLDQYKVNWKERERKNDTN